MSETVYVFGAGINKVLKVKSPWARSLNLSPENYEDVTPPLTDDFFRVALKLEEYRYLNEEYNILYEYISKNFGKSKIDLRTGRLNLEDCFTKIELQLNQAIENKDANRTKELGRIKHTLISLFINILNLFEHELSIDSSEEISYLGEYIYKSKPTIITFNYDYFIELSIEKASNFKIDPKSTELVWGWKKALGYGMKFDEIETFNLSIGEELIRGRDFYSTANPYSWSIFKLHGSLNWFQYLPIYEHPDFADGPRVPLPKELLNQTILRFDSLDPTITGNFDINGRYVSPIIITPEIHKDVAYKRYAHVLDYLWEKAKKEIPKCKNLIIIGYSFPESDTRTIELFENAFSSSSGLESLTIVNPDKSVDSRTKKICNFNKSVIRYDDLKSYLISLGME